MKTSAVVMLIAVFGLLAACSINPHPMDMSAAIQAAKTPADHEALAKHYDDAAKEMQLKADEHKQMLSQYESNKALYGKQYQTLTSHCQGLIRIYEQAAGENRAMAESHRQLAAAAQ